ncbi:radical SAM protein [Candidatus Woesearchaeota archaeon]|nr:radical SAM protein [Candidatus Woesearchaeota archaeon]
MEGIKKAYPAYLNILDGKKKPEFQIAKQKGILDKKIKQVEKILGSCELCERKCKVNRLAGELGVCKVGITPKIFGAYTHMGEEAELIPSATLFFSGCTMKCDYCQNAPDSMSPEHGNEWFEEDIAKWIEQKFKEGCRNVNFVGGDPTPYLFNMLKALKLCGADTPVVWNSNAYYSEKTAEILKDIVDVYLLDFRYFKEGCARRLSDAKNYPKAAMRNLLGASKDAELLIRLLLMPGHIGCDAKPILKWIKENLGGWARVNLLAQYHPSWHAKKHVELSRRLTHIEYQEVVDYAKDIGLKNLC